LAWINHFADFHAIMNSHFGRPWLGFHFLVEIQASLRAAIFRRGVDFTPNLQSAPNSK